MGKAERSRRRRYLPCVRRRVLHHCTTDRRGRRLERDHVTDIRAAGVRTGHREAVSAIEAKDATWARTFNGLSAVVAPPPRRESKKSSFICANGHVFDQWPILFERCAKARENSRALLFSRMNGAINSPFRPYRPFHPCRRHPALLGSPSSAVRPPSPR